MNVYVLVHAEHSTSLLLIHFDFKLKKWKEFYSVTWFLLSGTSDEKDMNSSIEMNFLSFMKKSEIQLY